ncbi:MAG: metallophosphoesterase family protein [Bacteroidota bacterium]|nr:metallophosphoesterase family protein [Bacteroidota bacterium]
MKIGFIGDIHEDIKSLHDAVNVLKKLNCDSIVCLGDIVGFTLPFFKYIDGRNANECISLVRNNCDTVLAGNHDLYAIKKIPAYNAGFKYTDDWYSLDYDMRSKLSKNKIWLYEDGELPIFLSEQSAEYLKALPEVVVTEFDGIKFMFSHFNYPDLSGSTIDFPRKAKHLLEHFRFMNDNNCVIGVSGHGHIEGYAIADHHKLQFHPFGSYQLQYKTQWLVGPCVANTTRANGIMIFDTHTYQLDVVPLRSAKTIK